MVWVVVGLGYYAWALTFDLDRIAEMPQRSSVYDRNGKFYSRLAGENRVVVPFDKVSNDFINALLAREDTRFYRHHGVDPIGILRAVVRNFVAGGFRQGASTITQQLARNSFPLGGKTIHRKLIEAALAYRIETELSKEAILEAYMNRIYFGSGYYGIEAASQAYFGKPASRLNLSESAMLAGLIRSPNRFSPFANPKRSLKERDMVLERMEDVGFITQEQCKKAKAERPRIAPRPGSLLQQNWAMAAIEDELGLVLDRDDLAGGGLRIYTTIDPVLQAAAEKSVVARLDEVEKRPRYPNATKAGTGFADFAAEGGTPYLQGAAIALDNSTGGILAIVGGRDLATSNFNRALYGRRQVGSLVKPFVFSKAFEAGLRPGDKLSDSRLQPGEIPARFGRYDPTNSDGEFRGDIPARDHLIYSRNPGTVRAGLRAGLDAVAESIQLAGMAPEPPRYPSLCLGAFESYLKDVTAAYTVFATGGYRLQPFLIERVEDSRGSVLFRATRGRWKVLEPQVAEMTTEILREVVERGTAAGARKLGAPKGSAGKTGTTDNYQDAWFVGFDRKITCGVWVGFDKPKKILKGGTGAQLALPIWADIMAAGK